MNNWKKRFAVIWAGQLFSILSSNAAQFAIVLWISLKTGSAEALSFAAIAALLPQMTLKVFSGTPYQVSLIEILFGVGTLAGGLLPPCCRSGSKHRLWDGCSCCSTASACYLQFSVCWRPDFSPTRWVSPRFSHSADSLRL